MYLKRLEIFGFKSFADKAVLNFESGITAIVGPNGCGKSNVFDSIRWVLGEQSMKELRGATKEDVIFNGTTKRAPLNFAEVSLTFSNENRVFPIEYDEVTVSRRLFRSGESEYLLNRTVVRLKDILELFMGTGVGSEAYSLIQQGKVDLVVSAKPEDRRLIFDEAAGITKYKAKKREALNKLKDTDQNLLRSNDIILEVKRQIASIERQAKKAQRYKEEYERLKVLEFIFAEHRMSSFDQERKTLEEVCQSFQLQEQDCLARLDQLNQSLVKENNLVNELDHKANELHQDDIKLENQIELEHRQVHFNEERIASMEQGNQKAQEQKNSLLEACTAQERKISSLRESFSVLQQTIERNRDLLSTKKNDLQGMDELIHQAKQSIKKEEEEIFHLSTQEVTLKNEITEIMKDFQGALGRKRRLDMENSKIISEKEIVDLKLSESSEKVDHCASGISGLQQQKESRQSSVSHLRAELALMEDTIAQLEKTILSLRSKREFIEEMRVQYEDASEPISTGKLITAKPPAVDNQGIIGKIKGSRKIEGDARQALESFFVEHGQGDLYELYCETKFIELDPEKITLKINELVAEVALKTQEKDRLSSEVEQQARQLEALSATIHEQERDLSRLEADKKNILDEANKLNEELTLISQEIVETREILSDLKIRDEQMNAQLVHVNEEIHRLRQAITQQQSQISQHAYQRENLLVEIAQIQTELDGSEEQERSYHENLSHFESTLSDHLKQISRIDEEATERQSKKEEYLKAIDEINDHVEHLKRQREDLDVALKQYSEQKQQVYDRIALVRPLIKQAESDLAQAREQAHAQQLRRQELSFGEQSFKDRLSQSYKISFDDVMKFDPADGLASLEVFDFSNVSPDENQELIQQEKEKANLKEFKERLALMRPEVQIEGLEGEIQQIKKRCDAFGTVNLVAIDEYEELRQRFEFLTKQQSDLIEAKQSLMNTITKINRTSRQLFVDTFTKVSEEFRIYFRMLFGGGEADLILVDPENVLESGIDIIAKPPGKKLQNIALLSGGEKTMAAIALIFAVFKVRPSPFCVLDEIDAALDESNVGRYSYLLQEFSKIAQFIVITHNKKTISAADVMYGVTMQERGVSKIVSVRLTEDNKEEQQEVREPLAAGV